MNWVAAGLGTALIATALVVLMRPLLVAVFVTAMRLLATASMRTPRVRLRRLMLVVALAAVALSTLTAQFAPWARRYRALAVMEADLAKRELALAEPWRAEIARNPAWADTTYEVFIDGACPPVILTRRMRLAGFDQKAAEHLRRRDAYLRCARYPWLSPPPSPPPQLVSTPVTTKVRQARSGR